MDDLGDMFPPLIVPQPRSMGWCDGLLAIGSELSASVTGAGSAACLPATRRFLAWLSEVIGLDVAEAPRSDGVATLCIRCDAPGGEVPRFRDDESCSLRISAARIHLHAPAVAGVVHGLSSLRQLAHRGCGGLRVSGSQSVYLEQCVVADRPRFPWRGLMLDVSRHFIPVAAIERQLDAMELVKLNVLHLHLTDDQGFRLESRAWPDLHRRGSDGDYYTQAEMRGLVGYAAARGIRIVPEFDLPGHASSWLAGYPNLGCHPGAEYRVAGEWGCVDVCMNPAEERVYEFLERFFADVLPIFPDEFVHIGGDEVTGEEWRSTPAVLEFMARAGLADTRALQAHFGRRVHGILRRHGKRVIGWEEIGHADMPNDAVVQCWRGADAVAAVAARGFDCVRSHGYYLNALQPMSEHYVVDPDPADTGRVLGGEACLWTEFVDASNLDSRLWPRAAAVAERFWSAREVRDTAGLHRRIDALRGCLAGAGIHPEQPLRDWLARASGADAVDDLLELARLLEPLPRDAVVPSRETDRHTALDRLSDALPADDGVGDRLHEAVDLWLAGYRGGWLEQLPRVLQRVCDRVEPTFGARARLADLHAFVPKVRELCAVVEWALGLGAVDAAAAWAGEQLLRLDRCAEPHAGARLAVVEPVRRMVAALGGTEC